MSGDRTRRTVGVGRQSNSQNTASELGEQLAQISQEEKRQFIDQLKKIKGEVSQTEVDKLLNLSIKEARTRRSKRNQSLTAVFEQLVLESGELTEFAKGLIKASPEEEAHVVAAEFDEAQAKEKWEKSRDAIPTLRAAIKTAEDSKVTLYERATFWVDEKQVRLDTANSKYHLELKTVERLKEAYELAQTNTKKAKVEAENMRASRMNSTDMEQKSQLVNEAYGAILDQIETDLERGLGQLKEITAQNMKNMDDKIEAAGIVQEIEKEVKEKSAELNTEREKLESLAKQHGRMSQEFTTHQKAVSTLESQYRDLEAEKKEEAMKFQTFEKYEQYFEGMIMAEEQTISDLRAFKAKFKISKENRIVGINSWVSQQQSANTLETTQKYSPVGDKMDEMFVEQALESGVAGRIATVEEMEKHEEHMARNRKKTKEFISAMEKIRDRELEMIKKMKEGDYSLPESPDSSDVEVPEPTAKPTPTPEPTAETPTSTDRRSRRRDNSSSDS